MAPTVFHIWNLRVAIYPIDHQPPHFHIIGPEAEAKFDLRTFECMESYGFTENSLRRICDYLKEREETLWKAWNEYQK